MKVYFTCSARGNKDFGNNYQKIFDTIKELGHSQVRDYREDNDPDRIYNSDHSYKVQMYHDHMVSIKACDVLVIEVSMHSLSMGFLMNKALEMGKPVIAMHQKGCEPAFAVGIDSDRLQVVEYNADNLKTVLSDALDYAKDQADIRFNFFISPRISNFLDWMSKEKRIPRSVYLRRLIENDLSKNSEYQEVA